MARLWAFSPYHILVDSYDAVGHVMISRTAPLGTILLLVCSIATAAPQKPVWKPVEFAIVRYNDEAPASWNIYHTEKRGVLLVRLWKRYLLVNVADEEVYDIDPQKVTPQGENVEWAPSDQPEQPIEISEWKERNVGPVQRIRFRFGTKGHVLELQLPLLINGKPAY
jgi:hypothetical protein